MSGLYVHIPYCSSRCIYCGFFSSTGKKNQSEYIDAVLKELEMRTTEMFSKPETVYFGGGTPSFLPIPMLDRLVRGIAERIDVSRVGEWTMECNPDDVSPELAHWLSSSPINRVSMGVQTFSDERLRWLHRRHSSKQVKEAVSHLRQSGIQNLSLDLMYGFPKQTIEEWKADISECLSLHPEHISAYTLMYEEGTPLFSMLEKGIVTEIDEDLSLRMFEILVDSLTEAGYEHYEISNFSLPRFQSRHNSNYWQQVPYLGIGAGAHSYDLSQRWNNVCNIESYISSVEAGRIDSEYEETTPEIRYNDIVTTALRTRHGIDLTMLQESFRSYLLSQAESHIAHGRLTVDGSHVHLTRKGIFTSDDIMSDLIFLPE